jgi:saccharopine dehydrogenase (NAD+, L-lysine-forming)
MTSILILGGTGYTGKLLARHLLERTNVEITLAARHLEKAQAFADELNANHPGSRVAAVHADAADAASLQKAFRGHDMVLVAAPTTAHAENVVRACLAAGADYLDVQLGAAKFALLQSIAGEVERAGRCFITEAGFHPGLPAVMVRYAAAQMESIESASVIGYLNMGMNLPYTEAVNELIEFFKEYKAQVFKAGAWTRSNSYEMRRIDLGSDLGRKLCYSMFMEELRPLPEMYPSLHEVGFFMSETHWMTDWVIFPLTWIWLKIMPGAVGPIGRLLWWGMGRFHKAPYRCEVQVRARGMQAGERVDCFTSIAHPDGYELTAIPVVATLLQYLDGSARKPGLWMMGHLAEPVRLLEDMQAMGATVQNRMCINSDNSAE